MELIKATVLGIVEGITEFLPISSTGHLLVAEKLLKFADPQGTFDIVIQLGAIIAVIWYFRAQLLEQASSLGTDARVRRFWLCVVIAFLPAAVFGLALHKKIEALFGEGPLGARVVAGSLIVGGVILWLVELRKGEPRIVDLYEVRPKQALAIGIAQVFSLIPGVSRSGSSIVGGLLCGLDRETATAFSFYLALPTLGSATLYKLAKEYRQVMASGMGVELGVGTAVSFVTALLAIGWLLRYVSSNDFRGFAWYRIAAGIVILVVLGV